MNWKQEKRAEKTVLETYIRETNELVHLTINGELIQTTHDYPFYVKGTGFVNAEKLCIGDKLIDPNGTAIAIENTKFEATQMPVTAYNFQVEDFHTYHVGGNGVFAQSDLKEQYPESEGYKIESEKLLRDSNGKKAIDPETGTGRRIDFIVDKDGNIVDSIEVTSTTADKSLQIAKEMRIRQSGGNYVRLDDGSLIKIPDNIITRIERRL